MENKMNTLPMICPECRGTFNFPADGLGVEVACPHCKVEVTLTDASQSTISRTISIQSMRDVPSFKDYRGLRTAINLLCFAAIIGWVALGLAIFLHFEARDYNLPLVIIMGVGILAIYVVCELAKVMVDVGEALVKSADERDADPH